MAATSKITDNLGGSAFWIIVILGALVGLAYLGIWSFHNNSLKGIIVSGIFFSMIVIGIVFSKFEIFNWGSWNDNCISFTLAFIIFASISTWSIASEGSTLTQSVLSISKNPLLESISSDLPRSTDFEITSFVAPISEELFWLVAIPIAVMTIMNLAGARIPALRNIWIQLLVITVICGLSFALFHVGKLILSFLVVAFIFRAITIVTVYGDQKFDIFPKITLVGSFALGAHVGNNWGVFGLWDGLLLLVQGDTTNYVGWMILVFLAAVLLTALNSLAKLFTGKSSQLG